MHLKIHKSHNIILSTVCFLSMLKFPRYPPDSGFNSLQTRYCSPLRQMTNTIGKIGATIHRPRTIFLPSSKARSEKFRYLEGYKKSIVEEEKKLDSNWICEESSRLLNVVVIALFQEFYGSYGAFETFRCSGTDRTVSVFCKGFLRPLSYRKDSNLIG